MGWEWVAPTSGGVVGLAGVAVAYLTTTRSLEATQALETDKRIAAEATAHRRDLRDALVRFLVAADETATFAWDLYYRRYRTRQSVLEAIAERLSQTRDRAVELQILADEDFADQVEEVRKAAGEGPARASGEPQSEGAEARIKEATDLYTQARRALVARFRALYPDGASATDRQA